MTWQLTALSPQWQTDDGRLAFFEEQCGFRIEAPGKTDRALLPLAGVPVGSPVHGDVDDLAEQASLAIGTSTELVKCREHHGWRIEQTGLRVYFVPFKIGTPEYGRWRFNLDIQPIRGGTGYMMHESFDGITDGYIYRAAFDELRRVGHHTRDDAMDTFDVTVNRFRRRSLRYRARHLLSRS